MGEPTQYIDSVNHWNITLRAARERKQPVIVDFFTTKCDLCKDITVLDDLRGCLLDLLAAQYPHAVFLKVDVDKLELAPISKKYQVITMLTFVVIGETGIVDMMRGADPRGLSAMVAKHASEPPTSIRPPLPAEAEKAKAEGNAAFTAGEYRKAIESYSRAIELAPKSAVLYGNRAIAYIKLIKSGAPPKKERQESLRPKLVSDANIATILDERRAKGWLRMAEALILACDEEGNEGVKEELREEGRRKGLEGAQQALENAVGLGEGKVKVEAEQMLEEVQALLKAL